MPQKSKKKEEEFNNAAATLADISARRMWLLWHNEKFRGEVIELVKKTGIKLRDTYPLWESLLPVHEMPMVGENHPEWQAFYAKHGIGNFWHEGKVIARMGERPFGVEIISKDDKPEYFKLVLWPNEINLKRIKESWILIENQLTKYFEKKNQIPWNVKIRNFWRDARWYNLRYRDTHKKTNENDLKEIFMTYYYTENYSVHTRWHNQLNINQHNESILKDIVKKLMETDPLVIDELFIINLINKDKDHSKEYLIDQCDPERKILGDYKISDSKINKLLHAFGIFIIANTIVPWGKNFQYKGAQMAVVDDSKLKTRGKLFIRYNDYLVEKKRFIVTDEELKEFENKEKIRTEFQEERNEYSLLDNAKSEFQAVVGRGIGKMEERINMMM